MLKEKLAELLVEVKTKLSPLQSGLAKANAMVKRGMKSMAKWAKRGAVAIGVGLVAAMTYAAKAAGIQEQAEVDLAAALRSTGDATGKNLKSLKEYATELQRATTYGDEEILTQMAYGKNLGITTDRLKDATKAAMGLAARYKLDLQAAMMLVGRASQGQTQMLTRYGIVLDETLSPQEKFNELLRIGAENFGLAEARADTFLGQLTKLRGVITDVVFETLGKPLLAELKPAIESLRLWFIDNQKLIAIKINEYYDKVAEALKKVRDNFNALKAVVKWSSVVFAVGVLVNFIQKLWSVVTVAGAVVSTLGTFLVAATGVAIRMSLAVTEWATETVRGIKEIIKYFTRYVQALRWMAKLEKRGSPFAEPIKHLRRLVNIGAKAEAVMVGWKLAILGFWAAALKLIHLHGSRGWQSLKYWWEGRKLSKPPSAKERRDFFEEHGHFERMKEIKRRKKEAKALAELAERSRKRARPKTEVERETVEERLKKEADAWRYWKKVLSDMHTAYDELGGDRNKQHTIEMVQLRMRAKEIAKITGLRWKDVVALLAAKRAKEEIEGKGIEEATDVARIGFVGIKDAWKQIASGSKRTEEKQLAELQKQTEIDRLRNELLEKLLGQGSGGGGGVDY